MARSWSGGSVRAFRALGVGLLGFLLALPLKAAPTSGPYEQTAIHRKESSVAPTTQPRGAAARAPSSWDMSKVPLALGGVLVLIFAMRWLGKKMVPGAGGGRANRAVQVLVRAPVSARQQLMLVQIGRR